MKFDNRDRKQFDDDETLARLIRRVSDLNWEKVEVLDKYQILMVQLQTLSREMAEVKLKVVGVETKLRHLVETNKEILYKDILK